ncbi:MAG: hypothetical protein ACP5QG_09405 [candidate division WOR-3 bacterium]
MPRHFNGPGHADGVLLWQILSEARSGATRYGGERRFAGEGIPYIGTVNITESGIDLDRRLLFPWTRCSWLRPVSYYYFIRGLGIQRAGDFGLSKIYKYLIVRRD